MANPDGPDGPCLRGTKEGIAEVEQAGEDEGGSSVVLVDRNPEDWIKSSYTQVR